MSPFFTPQSEQSWLENFSSAKIIELSHHQSKPNPVVINDICNAEDIAPDQCAYVGDSVSKDVVMAKKAGVFAIWAEYGAHHDPVMYQALVRISHWTPADIEREIRLKAEADSIRPDYVAKSAFAEVLIPMQQMKSKFGLRA